MGYTLYKLLEENTVKIPLIQRDYAQGRASEEKVRNDFIDKIKSNLLEENKKLNLDFVYGYTTKHSNDNLNFIPLDGQQRLTTLWLIHWYFAIKEGILKDGRDKNSEILLLGFTYETRISSKRFCEKLVQNPLIFDNKTKSLKDKIVDASWFMSSWNNDPTIKAMLNMIDTIHTRMCSIENVWHKLTEENRITFDYIDIKSEEFKLTDELYIKMNSRGKPLTPFENFKAIFSQVLNDENSDYYKEKIEYENSKVTYQQYFSFKVDGKWTDLFWDYKDTRDNLDDNFLNFFYYIAEMLHYRENKEDDFQRNFEYLETVFSKKKNVDFLFKSLDLLVGIKDKKLFFDTIFSIDEYQIGKVKLFGETNTDLFFKSFTNSSFEVLLRVLFYGLLKYLIETKTTQPTDDLINFIRILRNMLLRVRQINTSKRIEVISNLRLPYFNSYVQFIDGFIKNITEEKAVYHSFVNNSFKGFTQDSFTLEKKKINSLLKNPQIEKNIYKLEDHNYVYGIPDNFIIEDENFEEKVEAFYEIWNFDKVSNSELVRALLTKGDFSVTTHDYSKLGYIKYFGTEDYWNRIIAPSNEDEKQNTKKILNQFLTEYINSVKDAILDRLDEMLNAYSSEDKDWRYYFIKYKEITSPYFGRLNLFSWNDKDGFNINSLGNSGVQPLASHHLNPYLITIRKKLIECGFSTEIVKHYNGRYSEELSFLSLPKDIKLYVDYGCFKLHNLVNLKNHQYIINEFNMEKEDDYYILKELKGTDKIETAILFCTKVLQSNYLS
ncbi:DUF262 domain-containing protein [Mariniflexile aquimaris]|uniref:DUF262 domain-containing protein n=1 Tax=Mariniflexile aquimaris TaxID=881009 RepID=A0ABW3BUE5_9FLAO